MSLSTTSMRNMTTPRLGPLGTRVVQVMKTIGHKIPDQPSARDVVLSLHNMHALRMSLVKHYFGGKRGIYAKPAVQPEGVDWSYRYWSSDQHDVDDCALFAHMLSHGAQGGARGPLQVLFAEHDIRPPGGRRPQIHDTFYSEALRAQLVVESVAIAALGKVTCTDPDVMVALHRTAYEDVAQLENLARFAWEQSSADALRVWSAMGDYEIALGNAVMYERPGGVYHRPKQDKQLMAGPIMHRMVQAVIAGHVPAAQSLVSVLTRIPPELERYCAPEKLFGKPVLKQGNIAALNAVVQRAATASDSKLAQRTAIYLCDHLLHPPQYIKRPEIAPGEKLKFTAYPPRWYERFLQGLWRNGALFHQVSYESGVRIGAAGNRAMQQEWRDKIAGPDYQWADNELLHTAAILQEPQYLLAAAQEWSRSINDRQRRQPLLLDAPMNQIAYFDEKHPSGQLSLEEVVMHDRALGPAIRALPAMLHSESRYYDDSVALHEVTFALSLLAQRGSLVALDVLQSK